MLSPIQTNRQSPYFGKALSTKELKHWNEVYAKGQNALNKSLEIEKDYKIFIMPDFSMPSIDHENTGMGRLLSDETQKFLKLVKNYYKPDAIQTLPQNHVFKRVSQDNYFSPYSCSGYSLGEHIIDLKSLTKKEYGEIIKPQEFDNFVNKNTKKDIVNAENEIGIRSNPNPRIELLKTAFERFKKNDTPELNKLNQDFEAYKKDPSEAKRLEKVSLYEFLGHHENLFSEKFDNAEREKIISQTKQKYATEIDFYKFQNFLADNHHQKSRELLKQEGLELVGDCPFAFSQAEKWTNPDAFREEKRWGLPWLDYKRMFKPDNSLDIAGELMQEKITFFCKRYDKIRFDVACDFVESQAPITPQEPDKVLKFVENTVAKFYNKGSAKDNIIYEIFTKDMHDNPTLKQAFESRNIMVTQNSPKSLEEQGFNTADFFVGISNHDISSARDQFENSSYLDTLKAPESDIFEIKDKKAVVKFKLGEYFNTSKKFIFFKDFFGQNGVFNYMNTNNNASFRQKLSPKYEEEYHKALQNGDGFNLMESLAVAMKMQKLDKTEPKLFEEVLSQSKLLREPGALTQEEADKAEKKTNPKNIWQKVGIAIAATSAIAIGAVLFLNKKSQTTESQKNL